MPESKQFISVIKKYIIRNRLIRIIALPMALLMFISNWAELKTPIYISAIEKSMECRNSHKFRHSFRLFVSYYLLHYLAAWSYCSLFSSLIPYIKSQFLEETLTSYLHMDYKTYHALGTGQIASLAQRQSNALFNILEILMIHVGYNTIFFIQIVFCICTHFTHFWLLSFLFLSFVLFLFILLYGYVVNSFKTNLNQHESSVCNKMFDILRNFAIIKSFNNESKEVSLYSSRLQSYSNIASKYGFVSELFSTCFRLLLLFPYLIGIMACFYFRKDDSGSFFIKLKNYFGIFKRRVSSVKDLTIKAIECKSDMLACENEIINEESDSPECVSRANSVLVKSSCDVIEFKDVKVDLEYGRLFGPFSMKIQRGEKIAVTGRNGVGKSTILKLLMGFGKYEGKIFIDGIEINNLGKKHLRSSIAYVPQDSHILDGTIWDNITYGSTWNEEQITDLSKKCGMHGFIMNLPAGYSTNVGEEGRCLSGGQRQKLNFMRAIAKDAPIVLMDEPTSNLDYTSGKELLSLSFELLAGSTLFFSTHNPEYLSRFDKIINIRDGGVFVYERDDMLLKFADSSFSL